MVSSQCSISLPAITAHLLVKGAVVTRIGYNRYRMCQGTKMFNTKNRIHTLDYSPYQVPNSPLWMGDFFLSVPSKISKWLRGSQGRAWHPLVEVQITCISLGSSLTASAASNASSVRAAPECYKNQITRNHPLLRSLIIRLKPPSETHSSLLTAFDHTDNSSHLPAPLTPHCLFSAVLYGTDYMHLTSSTNPLVLSSLGTKKAQRLYLQYPYKENPAVLFTVKVYIDPTDGSVVCPGCLVKFPDADTVDVNTLCLFLPPEHY